LLQFKEQVPFKYKDKIPVVQCKEDLLIDTAFSLSQFSLDSSFKGIAQQILTEVESRLK
jgi:hypothetical protein